MSSVAQQPIYDPARTYDDNFDNGPFGDFAAPMPFHNYGRPMFEFLGRPVYSSFGIPAGPLLNAKYVIAALMKGFDIVTYKTQRSTVFEANAFPNILAVDLHGDLTLEKAAEPLVGRPIPADADPTQLTITNSFAVPSRGPKFWVPDFKKSLAAVNRGQLVIMSVQGTIQPGFSDTDYFDDFAAVTRQAAMAGARAIEVNLSCPNVATEGVVCYDPATVEEILRRCKAAAGPAHLLVKIGYFAPAQQALLEAVVRAMVPYIDGISAINTIAAPIIDDQGLQALPGPNRFRSGLCGAGIKWAGLDMVRRLAALRAALGVKFEVIGVGGVMTPADYHEYIAAGANLVQSATGAMWNPDLAIDIKMTLPKNKR